MAQTPQIVLFLSRFSRIFPYLLHPLRTISRHFKWLFYYDFRQFNCCFAGQRLHWAPYPAIAEVPAVFVFNFKYQSFIAGPIFSNNNFYYSFSCYFLYRYTRLPIFIFSSFFLYVFPYALPLTGKTFVHPLCFTFLTSAHFSDLHLNNILWPRLSKSLPSRMVLNICDVFWMAALIHYLC